MGYVYMICVAMLFSFGGSCVKMISPYFSSGYITFFRFFFGVFFLMLLKTIKRSRFRDDFKQAFAVCFGWILFGAVGKWLAYISENYALTQGPSYGNIITQPVQTVFLTLASVLLFKEKLPPRKVVCIILCMLGVLCISWNGRPLEEYLQGNALLTGLFVISGICAGAHVLAQKMVADKMAIIDSNLAIFAISAVLAGIPLVPDVAGGALAGVSPDLRCILAILLFGFITGIGFYLNATAILMIPFYMVPILQSTMVIFAIIWGVVFFHEPISPYIIAGTVMFLIGLIALQLQNALGARQTDGQKSA